MTDRTLVEAALPGMLLVDFERPLPLFDPDRAARECVELATERDELSGITAAVEEFEPHHVACRDLTFDEIFIEAGAESSADGACPRLDARAQATEAR